MRTNDSNEHGENAANDNGPISASDLSGLTECSTMYLVCTM